MTSALDAAVGPLTTATADLSEALLLAEEEDVATWLAYVGFGGRYAVVPNARYWHRWDGRRWHRVEIGEVHRAARRTLEVAYARCISRFPGDDATLQLVRLTDVNWRLGPLMKALREVAMVSPERLAGTRVPAR